MLQNENNCQQSTFDIYNTNMSIILDNLEDTSKFIVFSENKNFPGISGFTQGLYQIVKEELTQILLKFFPNIEDEGMISNSFTLKTVLL
jgi:hypothetical protein